jgi:glycosyltransferase involved in cell wall biosynthesis
MKKKNLLFVIPSLTAGGGEKSLINLLFQIDYSLYNVDLCLFNKNGVFLNSLPKEVKLLNLTKDFKNFSQDFFTSIYHFLLNKQFNLVICRIMFTIINRISKNHAISEQYAWKYIGKSFSYLEKEYDAAIGYLEKSSIYFVVDKVRSKKKIGWIHTNYSDSGMDRNFDDPYFRQLDTVVTVSEQCAESLKENFVSLKNKIRIIYNIVSPEIIYDLSSENDVDEYLYQEDYTNIVTLARLSEEKGIDLAISTCKLLVHMGYKIKWFVLGDGDDRSKLEEMIEVNGLNESFKLLGVKENPYPYLRKADIYVQPSRYEGKSIALDEAKILCKPIVVTNFETAKDQIQNEIDGLIVEMNVEGLCQGIKTLIKNVELKETLIHNLSKQKLGTEEEINKLYQILNE